jgi:hypothetical protein
MIPLHFITVCAAVTLTTGVAQVAHEPFAYAIGEDLVGQSGGSGWAGGWRQRTASPGASPLISATNLTFKDVALNSLVTSGGSVNSKNGDLTAIAFRSLANRRSQETWLSFLTLPSATGAFLGLTVYDGGEDNADHSRFGVEQREAGSGGLSLVNSEPSVSVFAPAFNPPPGEAVFVVIRMLPLGAAGGQDRLEVFFNPALAAVPVTPFASLSIVPGGFDRIRIAATNGKSALYDEIRVGDTFADVAPFIPATNVVGEDGLSPEQRGILGLDPAMAHVRLANGIRANPGLFGLLDHAGLRGDAAALLLEVPASGQVPLSIRIMQSTDLDAWSEVQSLVWSISAPAEKRFVRFGIDRSSPN